MTVKKHLTSLSVEYVPNWGIQEALRELFQNAIDHGDWDFCVLSSNRICITSKNAALDKKTLLLGTSNKGEGKIGRHGEGYKIACLVLLRCGCNVVISTGTETWTPRLMQSKTYGTRQLVFDVKYYDVDLHDVTVTVGGLSKEDLEDLKLRNLHINYGGTAYGILDEAMAGRIYVGGLYVCTDNSMRYGYNLDPASVSLDRDRSLIRTFDLQCITSRLWRESGDIKTVLKLIQEEAPDVSYLDWSTAEGPETIEDAAHKAFTDEHGEDAIPVSDQYEVDELKEDGHTNVVIVPRLYRSVITSASTYKAPEPKIKKKTPKEVLEVFKEEYRHELEELVPDMLNAVDELIEEAENWQVK